MDAQHRFPQIPQVLANLLRKKGDVAGALAEMRNYLTYAPNSDDTEIIREHLREEEKLADVLSAKQPEP